LSHFFLEKHSKLLDKRIKSFTKEAKKRLLNYSWPGNVRELENSIEYAVNIEGSNYITEKSFPERILKSQFKIEENSGVPTIEEVEKKTIIKALKEFGIDGKGKEKAADVLGIARSTLYRKIEKHNINIS
jgi:transcriptional regulator with PAS, ATPase and Fis domain